MEDGVELTVTAKSYVRDLFCMADKVDVKASVAEGMVSLLPGESVVLHIATGNVDAMLLVNVELGDPCVALLEEHEEMPVLAIAGASVVGNLPSLSSADADAVRQAVRYLYDLGHRQIASVGGPESLAHSYIRDSAFADVASELGMRYRCLHTDYTPETGREATKRLLAFSEHPTAIIYDNDVMALAGLGVAASQGIKVPEGISIMSWDDSFMCTAAYPNLTAMGRDMVDTGKQAAGLLRKLIGGERVGHLMEEPYELRARASTGPAPAAE
nr:substrate-binding domain-containing protein [Bifidobacterium catenulatum]